MKVTFDQHIGVFEDAVPKEWCENLIKIFDQNNLLQTNRQLTERIPKIQKEDFILPLHSVDTRLCQTFSDNFFGTIYPLYIAKYKLAEILSPNVIMDDFKLQKTPISGGYHVWHIEASDEDLERIMVYTLYLNDVEEGGETEFLIQSKRVKPKQGTVCIFPASYTHIHRGNPPLSGEKYIMTGWISYPHTKNPIYERFS